MQESGDFPVYRSPRRRDRRAKPPGVKTPRAFLQMVICLAVLGAALFLKFLAPDAGQSVMAAVNGRITVGIDAEATLETIGRAFRGEESFAEVFLHLTGQAGEPNTEMKNDPAPLEGSSSNRDDPAGNPGGTVPAARFPRSDGTGQEEEREEGGGETPRLLHGAGGEAFVSGPLLVDELFVTLPVDEMEDDTLPIPFGTVMPDKASFVDVSLPFDYVVPLDGAVSSGFGYREHPVTGEENAFHYGLDITGVSGTDIRCFADGRVAAAGNSTTYGKYLIVEHTEGFSTLYAHCSKLIAREGAKVKAGEVIARVGATGRATGPHLHFEVRDGATLLNPQNYLQLQAR